MPNVKLKPMINKRKTDLSLNGDLDDYTIRNKRGVREIKSLRARKYTQDAPVAPKTNSVRAES